MRAYQIPNALAAIGVWLVVVSLLPIPSWAAGALAVGLYLWVRNSEGGIR